MRRGAVLLQIFSSEPDTASPPAASNGLARQEATRAAQGGSKEGSWLVEENAN
jgi:hypothetical protein